MHFKSRVPAVILVTQGGEAFRDDGSLGTNERGSLIENTEDIERFGAKN